MSDFFTELRRRKIWWVAGVYLAAGWVAVQVVNTFEETLALPTWIDTATLVLLIVGFPIALILAWAQETQAPASVEEAVESRAGDSDRRALDMSIAVLPYDNLTDDPQFANLADGICEDILTHISTNSIMPVTGRNSSFRYRDSTLDLKDIGRELDVSFLLEGSVRLVGDRLRITSQLVEAAGGNHVWAERTDVPVADMDRAQDAVTEQISDQIPQAIIDYLRPKFDVMPEDELSALGLFVRAWYLPFTDPGQREERRALLRQAISREPDNLYFKATLVSMNATAIASSMSGEAEADRAETVREARAVLNSAGQNPSVMRMIAMAYSGMGMFDEGLQLARRALALRPRSIGIAQTLAQCTLLAGNAGECLEILQRRADRRAEDFLLDARIGPRAYMCLGDFESALAKSDAAVVHDGEQLFTWRNRANILAALGRIEEAEEALGHARELKPGFTVEEGIATARREYATEEYRHNATKGLELLKEHEAENRT